MATFPTLKVEIAFVSNPLDTAPTWVDVTAYVRHANGVDITRGRSDPWSHFQAGHLTLTFANTDRRFDSLYSAGPYFGNLKPGKQIRVTCTWSAVTYDLFRGFVGVWPQAFSNAGKDATVTVECYDGLEWAASVKLSSDPVYDLVSTLSGATNKFFFRQADSTVWADAFDLVTGGWSAIGTLQPTTKLEDALPSPALKFSAAQGWKKNGANGGTTSPVTTAAGTYTLSFWFQIDPGIVSSAVAASADIHVWGYQRINTDATSEQYTCDVNCTSFGAPFGALLFQLVPTAGGAQQTYTTHSVSDGFPHLITFVQGVGIYVDGVLDTALAAPFNLLKFAFIGGQNGVIVAAGTEIQSFGNGFQLQDFFLVDGHAMTAAEVQKLFFLSTGFLAETSAVRAGRYLDDGGWPSTWRDITSDPVATVGTLIYNGQQLITVLQELDNSEQGRIFVSKSGNMTMHARYYNTDVTRGSTSQATFTDDGTAFNYREFGYVQDDTDVRNDVTVTNSTGASRSTDSTSITANRRRSETVNTILSTLDQRQSMAQGLVVQWKDATVRVKEFTAGLPSNWATYLGLEIGDKITVKQTPMGVGSQFSKDLIVDSIHWQIHADRWDLIIGAAPVTPNGLSWFVLDTSALDGADVLGY